MLSLQNPFIKLSVACDKLVSVVELIEIYKVGYGHPLLEFAEQGVSRCPIVVIGGELTTVAFNCNVLIRPGGTRGR